MNATVKTPETLGEVLARITRDSRAVGEPLTARQLAAATVACGYRHPDHTDKGKTTIGVLTTVIDKHWSTASDPYTVAAKLARDGWALQGTRWRVRRIPRLGGSTATGNCSQGHGPEQWNPDYAYCRACRARKRRTQRATTRKDTAA